MKKTKFENYKPPTMEEISSKIKSKAGRRPELSKDAKKGKWTEQSLKVLNERYLKKDENGKVIETPEEMCWRVAWEMASAEVLWGKTRSQVKKIAEDYYDVLVERKFLPNSPTLMNAGMGNGLQYSGCYVLPVEDSLEGIFDAIKYQALIHQTGGGTGFSFSKLRPNGSLVKSSRGVASGPVSFMRIFDAATNEIKQGGRRRGANMGILRVDHPDILEFISCKDDGGITNFNISVGITNEFMDALEKGKSYNLINPKTKEVAGKMDANEVFVKIAEGAWKTGDPGIVFLDRLNTKTSNPVPSLGPVESTNPCGEQPLYPYDSCNLGSIFLTYFVKEENGKKSVDWEGLKETTRIAVRFLDSVIEVNPYPLYQVRKTSMAIRRIGLGIGGWADILIDLEIPYDSEEAISLADKLMKVVNETAIKESEILAGERGAFPMWSESVYKKGAKRRNSTVTTIAPTGSISIIAGASSGIEPLFAISFQHVVKDKSLERTLNFINPKFEEFAKAGGFWTEELITKVAEKGLLGTIEEIPEKTRRVFTTAQEIDHKWHILMQSAFQKHTENAVSKTINLPNGATVEDIKDSYLLAWETGCKGITVFRDGSKDAQVLNIGVKKEEGKDRKEEKLPNHNHEEEKEWVRPLSVSGSTYKIATPVGKAFITVNEDFYGNPVEVFINIGRAGSDVQAMAEALGRLISKSLKFGYTISSRERASVIIEQLKGIGGRRSVGFGANKILSLPDAVAYAMSTHMGLRTNGNAKKTKWETYKNGNTPKPAGEDVKVDESTIVQNLEGSFGTDIYKASKLEENYNPGDICPSCGAGAFVYQEGCSKCYVCGHSEC